MPSVAVAVNVDMDRLGGPGGTPPTDFTYLRPGGVFTYHRPDGTSIYIRP